MFWASCVDTQPVENIACGICLLPFKTTNVCIIRTAFVTIFSQIALGVLIKIF